MSRLLFGVLLVVLSALVGCGNAQAPKSGVASADYDSARGEVAAKGSAGGAPMPAMAPPAGGEKGGAAKPGEPAANPTPAERKIIYTATLDVVVKDLDAAVRETEKLVAAHKGYVARSDRREDVGSRRTATYTLRVPAEAFGPLTAGLAELGTAERNAVDSQDVTEEFIDVQARLKNLKAEEEVLNRLLQEKAKQLEDVLKIREQIKGVRGDIERAQARLDYLAKLTALSTVNLTLKEIKDYKPPTAPTFGDRVNRTFGNSWEALVGFGEAVALAAVALTPWLPVLVPLGLVGFYLLRKGYRAATAEPERPVRHHRAVARPVEPPAPVEVTEAVPEPEKPAEGPGG